MTLITHLKTQHFDIIMGDGRIMDIKANQIKFDNAQKVYHTDDKKYLIGYSADMYPTNPQYSTPNIIQSCTSGLFLTNKEINKRICEEITCATDFPKLAGDPVSVLNTVIISKQRTSSENTFIPLKYPRQSGNIDAL